MQSTFAAKDAELLRTVLLDGLVLDQFNSRQCIIAKDLKNIGLVQVISREYKMCANPNDHDYGYADPECHNRFFLDSESIDDLVYCDYCDREVDLDGKQIFRKDIVRLNMPEVIQFICRRFDQAGFNVGTITQGWTAFEVEGKSCVLCIPSHCTKAKFLSYHYVYSNPILYVYFPSMRPYREALPPLKYVLLEDLICRDDSWLHDRVEEALTVDVDLPSAEALEQAFDDVVVELTDSQFEQFASFVVNLAADSKDITEYERLLKRDRENVHGQYAVPVGGAGHSDGYVFKKHAYLLGLFDGKWQHIEAKRFASQNSVLDDAKFSGFYSNCKEQPGVVFLANNRVTGDVWTKIKEFYDRDGWAKYAIVPKDLFLEIIAILGGESILKEFLAKIRKV